MSGPSAGLRAGQNGCRNEGTPQLYVTSPEHVCVLDELDEVAGTITTFDYGQWDAKAGKPSGRRRTSTFRSRWGQLLVGQRVLRGWLDLSRLPGMIEDLN